MEKAVTQASVILPTTTPEATMKVLMNFYPKADCVHASRRFTMNWSPGQNSTGALFTACNVWVTATKASQIGTRIITRPDIDHMGQDVQDGCAFDHLAPSEVMDAPFEIAELHDGEG